MAFRFLFLADCQLGAYATFSGLTDEDVAAYARRGMRVWAVPTVEGFAWDAARYETAIGMANSLRPEFVVLGGDMIDDPFSEEQLTELMRITAGLDDGITMHWVPGNHDAGADTVIPTPYSLDKYRESFGPDYYSFDYGETRFVVLDTVVLDHPEMVPGELEEQREFVTATLSRADDEGVGRVILFGHHPLFLAAADEPDTYWNLPRSQRMWLLELIHAHRVPIFFAGHWHRNAIARDGPFEMVTSGPVGYPLGDDPSGFREVVVDPAGVQHRYIPLQGGDT